MTEQLRGLPHGPEWLAYAAPYALGALAPDERSAFESHLAGCDVCRSEVQSFIEVASLLAHAARPVEPSEGLRQRVLNEARRVRPLKPALIPWLAAAAGLVLAVGAGVEVWRLAGRVRRLEAILARTDSTLAARDSTLLSLAGPEVDVVTLAATGREPSARVFWDRTRSRFVVMANDLPAARPGRIYQLWAIAKGQPPISMGTFNTNAFGRVYAILPVDPQIAALGFIDNCGLTEEPAGGSPQPTETPRLLGAWRRTD